MKRTIFRCCTRYFIVVFALLFTRYLPGYAQQEVPKIPRVGYLDSFAPEHQLRAFRQTLTDLGYIEPQTIRFEHRYPKENAEQALELAAELVRLKVDVLVAADPSAIRAAKQATKTIPIVMITNQDPVATGLVASLAKPGGNVTGVTRLTRELSGKRLEVLKESIPSTTRVAVLWVRPTALGTGSGFMNYEAAAEPLKIQLQSLQLQRENPDIESALQTAVKERANAMVTVSRNVVRPHAKKIAALAVKHRLPTMCEAVQYVEAGCLMSYSTNDVDAYRRAAVYVDKILKGAKPGELPIEQPTSFEFVTNLRTAKQIGITIPPNVLARADKVIK